MIAARSTTPLPRSPARTAAPKSIPGCSSDSKLATLSVAPSDSPRREIAAKYDEGNEKIAKQNETIMRLNSEIQQLTSLKNELWNTRVEGRQLGMVASRRRKRSP